MRFLVWVLSLSMTGCLSFHGGRMAGEPRSATFAAVRGARVRFVDRGQGPAVVLLHGFASSLETWDRVVPVLARRHRVIALDLKGFGWTDRPAGDYSPREQAALVLALLDARGVDRAAIVGHSWGASIALAMALAAPRRVTRLALYDAWAYEDQLPTLFVWARVRGLGEILFRLFYGERPDERIALAFHDKRLVTEKLATDVERALDRPGTLAAALAAVRGQRYDRMERRYRTIRKPSLLLWGREDVVTPVSFGERLANDLGARLVVYPRCGHFPMLEAASASNAEIDRFLAEPGP
ncbi:MAG: alpha/beta fold hydrolase [Deltaproteobacteria bacterium]|nr:alpha/beta fold hydrolase [Deltaproteobacteria bacterium]